MPRKRKDEDDDVAVEDEEEAFDQEEEEEEGVEEGEGDESAYEDSEEEEEEAPSEEYESDSTESSYSASDADDYEDDAFHYQGRPRGGSGRPRGRPPGSGKYQMAARYGLPPLLAAAVERTNANAAGADGHSGTNAELLQQVVRNTVSSLADAVGPVGRRLPTLLPRTPEDASQMKSSVSQELKESISSLLMDPATRAALLEKLRSVQMPSNLGQIAPMPMQQMHNLPPIFRPPPSHSTTMLGVRKLNLPKSAVLRDLDETPSLTSTRAKRESASKRIDYSKFYREDDDDDLKVEKKGAEESEDSSEGDEEESGVEKILSYRKKGNKEEFLVKYHKRAYLHSEWVSRADMEKERMGVQRVKRFLAKPLSYHHYDDVHPYNPEFDVLDRIVFGWQYKNEESRRMETSYMVKWSILGYEDATWETEDFIKSRPDGPDAIAEYGRRLSLDAKRNGYLPLGRRPDPSSWTHFTESPKYKADNSLRPYQLEGLNWLVYCWLNRQSCIIADEMGLGKTVQSVSFLELLYSKFHLRGPFLIVAPLSTLPHWQREFENWTDLNVIVYHGSAAARDVMYEYEFFYKTANDQIIPGITKFDVLITTYEVALAGFEQLQPISWRVAIFDEAHRLKNRASKAAEQLKGLNVEHKVLLTGTPLQNNVEELWSLLNFLQPQRFFSEDLFMEEYGDLRSSEQVTKLQELLKPLMLRRLKEDVEKSIPVKEETIIEVELTPIQKRYYRAILEKNFGFLLKGTSSSNAPNLVNTMMELRKCCIHPFLIKGAEERILEELGAGHDDGKVFNALVQASGKLVLVDKLLKRLRQDGHKVLIFSQMTRCLDILSDYLRYSKYPFERIDGAIKGTDRQAAIDRFSDPARDSFVFLLCTRAGGVGINLTAADTVVIFDSDWNPQNDIQAQARCHRIGQTKSVKIYRLLARNTYEREMFDRAGMKLGLDRAILQRMPGGLVPGGGMVPVGGLVPGGDDPTAGPGGLSKNEVESLLKKGAYGILMDNDEASTRFCEEDIDQILARRTTVVRHGGSNSAANNETSIFSKATFSATTDDLDDIDIDDPNFWERWAKKMNVDSAVLASASGSGSADEPRIKRQLKRIKTEDLEIESVSELDLGKKKWSVDSQEHREYLVRKFCAMGLGGVDEVARGVRMSHNEVAALGKAWLRWALDAASDYDAKFKEDNEKLLLWRIEFEKTKATSEKVLAEFGKSDVPFAGATREECLLVKAFNKTLGDDCEGDEKAVVVKMVLQLAVMELLRGHLEKHADDLNALPIPASVPGSPAMPAWWGREEDQALLVGTYRLGYGAWEALRSSSEYIFCTMNWEEATWPSGSTLGDRLRKILAAMEKRAQVTAKLEAHKHTVMAPRKARASTVESSSDEEEIVRPSKKRQAGASSGSTAGGSTGGRRQSGRATKTAGEEDWPYKDRMEFVRVLCLQGIPPLRNKEEAEDDMEDEGFIVGNLPRHQWKLFKQVGELGSKSNLQLDRFLQDFVKGCRDLVQSAPKRGRNKKNDADDDYVDQDGDLDEEEEGKKGKKSVASIGLDRAKFCLDKIDLLQTLREEILPNCADLAAALERARRSSGLPKWWQSGAGHDVPFLHAVAKYGLAKPSWIILDPAYPFVQVAREEAERRKVALEAEDVAKLIAWPNDSILQRRVEYLVDLVRKSMSAGHGTEQGRDEAIDSGTEPAPKKQRRQPKKKQEQEDKVDEE